MVPCTRLELLLLQPSSGSSSQHHRYRQAYITHKWSCLYEKENYKRNVQAGFAMSNEVEQHLADEQVRNRAMCWIL